GSYEGTAEFAGKELVSAGRSDILVAKFNANGDAIWSKSFGAKDEDWGNGISSDSLGNTYVTGWFRYEVAFGETKLKAKGDQDAMLIKLDPKGEVLWAKSFGNKSLDMGKAVATTPDNGVVAIGVYHLSVDLGSGELKPIVTGDKPNQSAELYLGVFGP
ncbi:MAG: SBBP repeat-containing protein, partial [Kofleriaceae bacterium]|nr:SBBP repeat-containing protein [Kofleriaceae bacterium]